MGEWGTCATLRRVWTLRVEGCGFWMCVFSFIILKNGLKLCEELATGSCGFMI